MSSTKENNMRALSSQFVEQNDYCVVCKEKQKWINSEGLCWNCYQKGHVVFATAKRTTNHNHKRKKEGDKIGS